MMGLVTRNKLVASLFIPIVYIQDISTEQCNPFSFFKSNFIIRGEYSFETKPLMQ